MFKTFKISFSLSNAYRVNSILYALKQIPLIKKILPESLYQEWGLKVFANVLSGIWEVIKAFLGKLLYLLIMIVGASFLCQSMAPQVAANELFLHMLVFLTMIGAVMNTYIFNPTRDKYYALILMRMDARKYALANYGYAMLKVLIGFLVFVPLLGRMQGVKLWQCLLVPFFIIGAKLTVIAWSIRDYEKTGIASDENNLGKGIWTAIILLLIVAYGPPFLGIVLPEMVSVGIMGAGIIAGVVSLRKVLIFQDYRGIYQQILAQYMQQVQSAKQSAKKQSEKVILTDAGIASDRRGFEYLNELFIKRHQKLLWKSSKWIALASLGIIGVIVVAIMLIPKAGAEMNRVLLTFLPYFVFIMYFLNRGMGFTRVLFMNCDHSLLTYSFYKQPKYVLSLFKIRLREIIKVNLLPAVVIGIGLAILLYVSGGTDNALNYVVLLISVPCMSVFFSVHYLTIYYLLQPYNAGTEMKSGMYQIVSSGTYLVCYLMTKVQMPTFVFGGMTIVFCVVYCVVACMLIYRLAPKTFRLRV